MHRAPPGYCGGGGALGGCGGVGGGGGEGAGDGGGGGGLGGSGGAGGAGGEEGGAGARQPPVSRSKPLKSSLFTVAEGKPESASEVARQTMASETSPTVSAGYSARICEATPVTCGHAIEVPEIRLVCVSEPTHAAVMSEPGACMSTHEP